jgi:hypothetical protein
MWTGGMTVGLAPSAGQDSALPGEPMGFPDGTGAHQDASAGDSRR